MRAGGRVAPSGAQKQDRPTRQQGVKRPVSISGGRLDLRGAMGRPLLRVCSVGGVQSQSRGAQTMGKKMQNADDTEEEENAKQTKKKDKLQNLDPVPVDRCGERARGGSHPEVSDAAGCGSRVVPTVSRGPDPVPDWHMDRQSRMCRGNWCKLVGHLMFIIAANMPTI